MGRRVPSMSLTAAPDLDGLVDGAKGGGGAYPTAPRGKQTRTLVARADGTILARMTIYLDPEVAQRIRKHCADTEVPMSEYVAGILEKASRKFPT